MKKAPIMDVRRRLKAERPAVLQWALRGCRNWLESSLHKNSNDPDGRTSSTASTRRDGIDFRNSTIICLPIAGTVAREGSTLEPVSCTAACPSDPETLIRPESDSSQSISCTLPLNWTKATSIVVETYVKRIVRDSVFQRLIHSMAWSTDEAVFLCMAMLLGSDWACQLAAEQELFSAPVTDRVRAALLESSKYTGVIA